MTGPIANIIIIRAIRSTFCKILVQVLITLVCSIVGAMTLQVLIVALVFASSQVHVNCNAVLKSNEPNAENDSASTCSGASAACVDANFEAGRKKGSANVLLQSQSDMKSRPQDKWSHWAP